MPTHRAQLIAAATWQATGVWARLPDLRVPTLVAVGTDDRLAPAGNGIVLAKRIPGARLVRFEGLRHMFFAEQPSRFVKLLDGFIGAASRAAVTAIARG